MTAFIKSIHLIVVATGSVFQVPSETPTKRGIWVRRSLKSKMPHIKQDTKMLRADYERIERAMDKHLVEENCNG